MKQKERSDLGRGCFFPLFNRQFRFLCNKNRNFGFEFSKNFKPQNKCPIPPTAGMTNSRGTVLDEN